MKKVVYLLIILGLFYVNQVYATSGAIKQSSVIQCGEQYYGSHGNPMHWHIVSQKDGKWVNISGEVDEPSCYKEIANEKVSVTLNKCVDGDTIKVNVDGEVKTVRFLAIDTPESVHPTKEVEEFGKEASDYTCNLVTNAQNLYLEYDKNSDKEDKYGRLLAYVYADELMLQKELIKKGYAKVAYLYDDYTYTSELLELESLVKEEQIGIWGDYQETSATSQDDSSTNTSNDTSTSLWDIFLEFISQMIDKIVEFIENML